MREILQVLQKVKKGLVNMKEKYGDKRISVEVDNPNDKTLVITIQLED